MAGVDATIVFLPRFTTLVGPASPAFYTAPMDVSKFEGAQIQVWRGPIRGGTGTFTVSFEESLDSQNWVNGPSTPVGFVIGQDEQKYFSYGFRLRWFRLKIVITGSQSIVTCWAEGLLRGGSGGLWASPATTGDALSSISPPGPAPAGSISSGGNTISIGGSPFLSGGLGGVLPPQSPPSSPGKFGP